MKRVPALLTIAAVSATVFLVLKDDPLEQARTDCIGWPDNPARTIEACETLLAEQLSDVARGNVLFYKGLAFDLSKDTVPALAAYDDAARLIPQRRSIYHNRARIHLNENAWDKVLSDTDVLLSRWPDARDQSYFGGLWFHARALEKTGNLVGAVDALTRYIEDRPDKAFARRKRAAILKRDTTSLDRIDALLLQLEDLSTAMSLDPDQYKDYEHRVEVLKGLGLNGPAMRDGLTGIALIQAKQRAKAEAGDLSVGQLHDTDALLQTNHAAIELLKDQMRAKITTLGDDWDGLMELSTAHYMNGDLEAARESAQAALALRPEDEHTAENIAFIEKVMAVTSKIGLEPLY